MKPRTIWILTILTLPVMIVITVIVPVVLYFRRIIREWHESIDRGFGE